MKTSKTVQYRVIIMPDDSEYEHGDYSSDSREAERERANVEQAIEREGLWGYEVQKLVHGIWEELDSCCGFIGTDSMLEQAAGGIPRGVEAPVYEANSYRESDSLRYDNPDDYITGTDGLATLTSDKLHQLADYVERLPRSEFDFSQWGNECGTVHCAAGWIPAAFPRHKEAQRIYDSHGTFDPNNAAAFLGLDKQPKRRKGEEFGHTDFQRMFLDSDDKLAGPYLIMSEVPATAVARRLQTMARYYASKGR